MKGEYDRSAIRARGLELARGVENSHWQVALSIGLKRAWQEARTQKVQYLTQEVNQEFNRLTAQETQQGSRR